MNNIETQLYTDNQENITHTHIWIELESLRINIALHMN